MHNVLRYVTVRPVNSSKQIYFGYLRRRAQISTRHLAANPLLHPRSVSQNINARTTSNIHAADDQIQDIGLQKLRVTLFAKCC